MLILSLQYLHFPNNRSSLYEGMPQIRQERFITIKFSLYVVKRISIMLDDELHNKLRVIQAKQLKKSVKTVSFSSVINQLLRKGIKNIETG